MCTSCHIFFYPSHHILPHSCKDKKNLYSDQFDVENHTDTLFENMHDNSQMDNFFNCYVMM